MFIVENEHEIALAGFLIAMVGLHLCRNLLRGSSPLLFAFCNVNVV